MPFGLELAEVLIFSVIVFAVAYFFGRRSNRGNTFLHKDIIEEYIFLGQELRDEQSKGFIVSTLDDGNTYEFPVHLNEWVYPVEGKKTRWMMIKKTFGRMRVRSQVYPDSVDIYHKHDGISESVTMIKGRCNVMIDGKENELNPGESIYIPPGSFHKVSAIPDENGEMYNEYEVDFPARPNTART